MSKPLGEPVGPSHGIAEPPAMLPETKDLVSTPSRLASFVTQKIPDKGEDGAPIAIDSLVGDVLAVFDGLGGAGSTMVPALEPDKPDVKMAFLASQAASSGMLNAIKQLGTASTKGDLKHFAEEAIVKQLESLSNRPGGKGAESKLRGSIFHSYPTTVAMALIDDRENPSKRLIRTHWAGDSRIYILDNSQDCPLQVLTSDHNGAASSAGGGDAALTRLATPSGLELDSFPPIGQGPLEIGRHSIVFAMTDGCYAYCTTFKLLLILLNELSRAANLNDWTERLRVTLSSFAGDDCSMAISLPPDISFESLKELYEPTTQYIDDLRLVPETMPPNPFVSVHAEAAFSSVYTLNAAAASAIYGTYKGA